MRIEALPTIKCNKLHFKGSPIPRFPKTWQADTFVARLPKEFNDPQFNQTIDSLYSRIERTTHSFNAEKLEGIISSLRERFPTRSENEILTVLQRLTQWANYPSLTELTKIFKKHELGNIPYRSSNLDGIAIIDQLNPIMSYFQRHKRLIPYDTTNKPVYFLNSNNILEAKEFAKNNSNTVLLNLEGFDAGVNIFNSDNLLEQCAERALSAIPSKLKGDSFLDALKQYLNFPILSHFEGNNFNIQTITRSQMRPNRQTILKQMQPFSPGKDKIKSTIQKLGLFTTNNLNEYKDVIRNVSAFFDKKLCIKTKQELCDSIEQINPYISGALERMKIAPENTYYVIPSWGGVKSYNLITHMYAKQNDIPSSRILNIGDMQDLVKYPDNSAYIILDDYVCSGNSLIGEFNYHGADTYRFSHKKHLLFCPLFANSTGYNNVKEEIARMGRYGIDNITLNPNNLLRRGRELFNDSYFFDDATGRNVLGFEGYGNANECLVFPYMAPDNNSDMASFITQFFFANTGPLKNSHKDLHAINSTSFRTLLQRYYL